jgi:hypothetical protein
MSRSISLASVILLGISCAVANGAEPIPLHVAVEKGLVSVAVNGRGAASGDSVQVTVQRQQPGNLVVSVDAGTVIHPKTGSVQSMTLGAVKYEQVGSKLRKATQIKLSDGKRHVYILEGYCRDIRKPTPGTGDQFDVRAPDSENAKVLVQAKRLGATVKVTQGAIWIQRSDVSDDELMRRFNMSSEEIQGSRKLLVAVNQRGTGVDVKVLFDRLRTVAKQAHEAQYRRGDTVTVTTDGTLVTERFGSNVIGKLEKDTQLKVLGAVGNQLIVRIDADGGKQRGLLKMADVKVAKRASRTLRNAVRGAVGGGDFVLEVFDKVNVSVRNR